MATTDRVFGISSSVCAPITGFVVSDATIDGKIGTIKKLTGNPFTTVVETRMSTPMVRTMTVTGAYESHTLTQSLLGTTVTLTVDSDTTNVGLSGTAGPSGVLTLTGICTAWDVKLNKDGWAVASITIEKKGV